MGRTCYALLVGINVYPSPTPSLHGCLNDIAATTTYLRTRFAPPDSVLHILELTDGAATRKAVIDGFRNHLGHAGTGDLALFVFSGHGSQQAAPPELWAIEPDRQLETLVCYDSRDPGCSDLADKELALLIAEVATAGSEVVVILDCCHSGTATRDLNNTARIRGLPIDDRPRPWSSFLNTQTASNTRGTPLLPLSPQGRHVLLAACEDREVAYECMHVGLPRGNFSASLFEILSQAERPLSYREVLKGCAARLRAGGIRQSPQLEATHSADLNQPFLGGATRAMSASLTIHYDRSLGWIVDAGSLHGMVVPKEDEPAILALYPYSAEPSHLRDPAASIGQARVTECFAHQSRISFDGIEPARDAIFAAVPHSLPWLRISVGLIGSIEDVQRAGHALTLNSIALRATSLEEADIVLHAEPESCTLTWPDEQLIARYRGELSITLATARARLEQIAHWRRLYVLRNPTRQQIVGDDVRLELRSGDKHIWTQNSEPPRMSYRFDGDRWHCPIFEVVVTNHSSQACYCALLALSDDHTVTNLLANGCMRLEPGAHISLRIGGTVCDELWAAGVTETTSYLKLIRCAVPFDAFMLEHATTTRDRTMGRLPRTLNDLLQPHSKRGLFVQPTNADPMNDWATVDAAIVIIRPAPHAKGGSE